MYKIRFLQHICRSEKSIKIEVSLFIMISCGQMVDKTPTETLNHIDDARSSNRMRQ